ncbi:MAG: 16S rRNA (adenine(1518)-N(6)/adenine(1519)-N(6))-dimethyltransferase RsmA [Cyclobacteriaceae bacterium]
MTAVRAKKRFGQHFLKDQQLAAKIVASLNPPDACDRVVEVGPGMGVLSQLLFERMGFETFLIEIDRESIAYLKRKYPDKADHIISGDFLSWDPLSITDGDLAIIGNFPYNISSQILFKVLDYKDHVVEVVGMLQKEVAERISSSPGKKAYGILSVLLQAFYKVEYLFTVGPESFAPPPKVSSAVVRLQRLPKTPFGCDQKLFKKIIKQGFQNRRKTLRNALKPFNLPDYLRGLTELDLRAEQLSVADFVSLTNKLAEHWKK